MAFSLLASVVRTGQSGGTTAAIDTTGATLLVVSFSQWGAATAGTVSDSKGNTWTPLTYRNPGQAGHRFFYVRAPTVGTGHTFTASGGNVHCVATFFAFGGSPVALSAPVETGATATSGTSLATGAVTPASAGALIVSGWAGMNNAINPVVGSGLTQTTALNAVASVNINGGAGYLVQTTAATINPVWSWTAVDHVAEAVVAFLPLGSPVPDVFNALEADAATTLTAAGFTVGPVTYVAPPVAVVTAQAPVAGTEAVAGYPVDLWTTAVTSGHVVSQSPTAGTVAAPGTPVSLVVVEVSSTLETTLTQAVVELLTLQPTTEVTQDVVELLALNPHPVRVTAVGLELLIRGGTGGTTRTSQLAVEVFHPRMIPTHTTQLAVEIFAPHPIPTRFSQTPVEFYQGRSAATRSSQEAVEVFLTIPPCITGAFPVDDAPAGGSCPARVLP